MDKSLFIVFLMFGKNPLISGFIFCDVYVLIIRNLPSYFLKDRKPHSPKRAEKVGGGAGLVVCMFFWHGPVKDTCYSFKCVETVPFALRDVSFYCSSCNVFAWKPKGKGWALWPCESRLVQYEVRRQWLWPLRHILMCTFKNSWIGLKTRWLSNDMMT